MRSLAALQELARTFEELPEELLRALDGSAEQCADLGVDIADAGSTHDVGRSDPERAFYGYLNSHPELLCPWHSAAEGLGSQAIPAGTSGARCKFIAPLRNRP